MKVLLANKFFFRNGGSEAVMLQEREFLKQSGVSVIDFSMRDERNIDSPYASYFVENVSYGDAGGLSALINAATFIHSPRAVRQFSRLLDDERPSLVHCHNIYHQLTPSILHAARKRGIPTVLTLHDFKPVCPVYTRLRNGEPCSACLHGSFVEVIRGRCAEGSLARSVLLYAEAAFHDLRRSYGNVDLFLAPSEFMRASMVTRFPAEKIAVLRNGVDTDSIDVVPDDKGYGLYLGRLTGVKGVDTLLRAYAAVSPTWPLVVAGTGPDADRLKASFPQATFTGHVERQRLADLLAGAAVVVVPSEWYENCPMSVLEAMAYSKAIVASNIGGISELVVHDETGLLFEPGSVDSLGAALHRIMSDSALRRRLGTAGRRRAESAYSLASHNARLLEIYSSLVRN